MPKILMTNSGQLPKCQLISYKTDNIYSLIIDNLYQRLLHSTTEQ